MEMLPDIEMRQEMVDPLVEMQELEEVQAMLDGGDDDDAALLLGARGPRIEPGARPTSAAVLNEVFAELLPRGDVARLAELIDSGSLQANERIGKGPRRQDTLLHWAARHGHLAQAQMLLEKGGDKTLRDELGHTAIQVAAEAGHLDVVGAIQAADAPTEEGVPPPPVSAAPASVTEHDVIIVGLGPTGATLANLLGACGVSVLVLERAGQIYPLPRAVHFDDETMRIFQAAGCAEAISKVVRLNPGMQFVDPKGNMLLDWPRPQVITSNGWHASFRFHQPDVEGILVDGCARYPHVTLRRNAAVTAISDDGSQASVRFTAWDDERWDVVPGAPVLEARCKYLVGCDGATSATRAFMAGRMAELQPEPQQPSDNMEDLGYTQRFIVADAVLKRPMPELGDHTRQTCDPERPSTYTRQPGERRRWEMAIKPEETDEEVMSPEWVWDFVGREQVGRPAVTPDDVTPAPPLTCFPLCLACAWCAWG